MSAGDLWIAPAGINEARAWIFRNHRHLPISPKGGKFALALLDGAGLVHGMALVGHGARLADGRWGATVTRLATDGTDNACSMLYGAVGRVWRQMGGRVLYTYTLAGEPGASLLASGWIDAGMTDGGEWHRAGRPRDPVVDASPKRRWVKRIGPGRAAQP